MLHQLTHPHTSAQFRLVYDQSDFDRIFYGRDRKDKLLTIAWNRGVAQKAIIDNVVYDFPANSVLSLMVNETFHFERPSDIVAWQFNRDFYCIVNHDKEVSCVGFLFYGSGQRMFMAIDEKHGRKLDLLLQVFKDEFEMQDPIQGEMMLALLKRLIIIITRLARDQYISEQDLPSDKLDIVRKYNLLVENHYRQQHQVKFYADQLNKSPKTLSNLFALYNHKSPLQVIQERVTLEARRLFFYTDKTAKEIAYELGFEDANHFSKFFKKQTGQSPTDFKKLNPLI
ncbi:AraC family transcriptional regulator [Dyadobacter fermentans]|uniref:AraC family transcriptional regulator n=1 Tax=Dyadobacter fermentans TaxID=94254 RepID=UPI001CC1B33F|nr:helix-turn-helix domain-containing protein [Dyadobacter fermentans]MBZ1360411.1 helix-turn-helix domain-containing protein [Dyadobacter fermentans]